MRGHIRRRSPGSFELKVELDRVDGKRRTRYRNVKVASKREAQIELARMITQIERGGYVDPTKLTVIRHVLDRVAVWRGNNTITARTHERYLGLIEHQLKPFPIASRLLQKLVALDIEQWHAKLLIGGRHDGNGGLSARTIGHVHKVLSRALDEAVKHGLVLKNVAREIRPPKIVSKKMRILTRKQMDDLPALLDGDPICAPAIVAVHTGMRLGELLALTWSNVNLSRKVIEVRNALEATNEYGVRFKKPKTKSGVRDIGLPDIVVETLRKHRRQQLDLRIALGFGELSDGALVFPYPGSERPWPPDNFSAMWSNVAARRGIDVSFHGLRHTHASFLIAIGRPITEIAHRLGHASPETTLRIYAHLFERDVGKAADAINAALNR